MIHDGDMEGLGLLPTKHKHRHVGDYTAYWHVINPVLLCNAIHHTNSGFHGSLSSQSNPDLVVVMEDLMNEYGKLVFDWC